VRFCDFFVVDLRYFGGCSASDVSCTLWGGGCRGQLSWSEKQLAEAQQKNRPPGDLPGFAAPLPAAEGGKGEDQVIPLWNPIPFINPEKNRVGIRKDVWTNYQGVKDDAPPPAEDQAGAGGQEEDATALTASADGARAGGGVLEGGLSDAESALIFDDRPEKESGYEFEEGAQLGSARTVSVCPATDRPLLRGERVDPAKRAFTYVDENNCIGCTQCAQVARNTFFMEDDNGRARAYSQNGDTEDVVQEAVDCCPVSCIHPVTLDELKFAEKAREGEVINNKSRLVGGSYTAEEKGGTPWMQVLAKRVKEGTMDGILGF